ncbi:MAG: alpha/beta hydrolase fold domain-containing protein [Armatimonadetes bacterium]|nr:alpha/beta hydrolase fold domain-containing protein [Armatimonadota bacterium]
MNELARVLGLMAAAGTLAGGCQLSPHVRPPAAPAWTQSLSGPGSARYRHGAYGLYQSGSGPSDYALYTPAAPVPRRAPVVVFLHGWGALDPGEYSAWTVHLARKGNIVICPRWQDNRFDANGRTFLPDAVTAVRAALGRLEREGPVRPQAGRFALFGHSIGATLAADMAAQWVELGLPRPRALFCVTPGSLSAGSRMRVQNDVAVADFSRLPEGLLLVVLVGEDDTRVGTAMADRIYDGATALPVRDKSYLTVRTDRHGEPPLIADHKLPLGTAGTLANVDALDYYALWRTGDALLDAAFTGRHREYRLGNTPQQRYMGKWPDGTPVIELAVR